MENQLTPVNFFYIYISPLKSLNFVLTLGAKFDGHRDTLAVCKDGGGNTIYKFISEMFEEVQYCGNLYKNTFSKNYYDKRK